MIEYPSTLIIFEKPRKCPRLKVMQPVDCKQAEQLLYKSVTNAFFFALCAFCISLLLSRQDSVLSTDAIVCTTAMALIHPSRH
jgi:hypothetical protein